MKNQKGFTLMELVVVIVIIGILAAIAVPKLMNLGSSAQEAACKQNRSNIISAANVEYSNWVLQGNNGNFTTWSANQSALFTNIQGSFPSNTVPSCPAGGTYTVALSTAGIDSIACSIH